MLSLSPLPVSVVWLFGCLVVWFVSKITQKVLPGNLDGWWVSVQNGPN